MRCERSLRAKCLEKHAKLKTKFIKIRWLIGEINRKQLQATNITLRYAYVDIPVRVRFVKIEAET